VNAISKTAFICCGIRAADARSRGPICADTYAEDFMTDEGKSIWQRFAKSSRGNAVNVARARIVQDEISRHIKQNKDLQIVNIGAGFDSRAYRLAGGRWFEFDEPAIIEHKNDRVPAHLCPNPLQRTAVDFKAGGLAVALRQCDAQAETVVVIEGVFQYLDKSQILSLLDTLSERFPRHTLICDLMNKTFFERYMRKKHDDIRALGSEFKFFEAKPEQLFLNHGYAQQRTPHSIVGQARDFKAIFVPTVLFHTALRSLRDGYRIHTFNRS
jgi:methyltransferase (TIGR00027 family)